MPQAPTELILIDVYMDRVEIIVSGRVTVIERPSSIGVSQWMDYWDDAKRGPKDRQRSW